MSITITDPALLAQLRAALETVELRDPEGNLLGTLALVSPFTRAEMDERRRKNRSGRPLADIVRDLERRGE
jgi:hypothetical protein